MMNKEKKKSYIEEMKKNFSSHNSVMIAHYQGLNVKELDELRKLRNPYVHAKVGLKAGSLMKRFIKEQHFDAEQMAKLDAVRSLEILKKFKDASVSMWFYEDEA